MTTAPPIDLPKSAPMAPDGAARFFRHLVETRALRLSWALHARRRLVERGLTADDVWYLLANGTVPKTPRRVDGLGRSKYTVEGPPRPEVERVARVIVLAAPRNPAVRVLTVMWVDEPPESVSPEHPKASASRA